MFSQDLIAAAAKADSRKQVTGSIININHVYNTQHQPSQGIASGSHDASLIAFFRENPSTTLQSSTKLLPLSLTLLAFKIWSRPLLIPA